VDKAVEQVERKMCELFKGSTTYPAFGGRIDDKGLLHREAVKVVQSFCTTEDWKAGEDAYWALALMIGEWLVQAGVGTVQDGLMTILILDDSPEEPESETQGDCLSIACPQWGL